MKHNPVYFSPSAAEAFAKCFVEITTAVAADVLGNRLGSAMGTRAAIVGKVQSDAEAVQLADAVDRALAAGTLGEDGAQ